MKNSIYNFDIKINHNLISDIDDFSSKWSAIEQGKEQSLKQLKEIATVQSVAASNRIEGSKMTNEEVELLLSEIDSSKFVAQNSQELVGYFETLEVITENFNEIDISVSNIKSLHNLLLKHSQKDEWHRGDYKKLCNALEITHADNTKQIVFESTKTGLATEIAMENLINWYNAESEVHALVKISTFIYEFLNIQPFQDGNSSLSRLLTSLLLLQNGYKWVEYISLENEIEHRKSEYQDILRTCQAQPPNEEITPWTDFFLAALRNIQQQLMLKLEIE